MCLITFAYKTHPRYLLVLAANRDEFLDRPAAPAASWSDAPGILAGRDLKAGGTWLGITRSGRFAAITNYRDLRRPSAGGPSRGHLVRSALEHGIDMERTAQYEGFNLIHGPLNALAYHNNIGPESFPLAPGIHGLSNHLLNTPWPKVQRATADLEHALSGHGTELIPNLFDLLLNDTPAPDDRLPETGLPPDMERAVSPIFIRTSGYGTRCSTVLLVDHNGLVRFEERTHPHDHRVVEEFKIA